MPRGAERSTRPGPELTPHLFEIGGLTRPCSAWDACDRFNRVKHRIVVDVLVVLSRLDHRSDQQRGDLVLPIRVGGGFIPSQDEEPVVRLVVLEYRRGVVCGPRA